MVTEPTVFVVDDDPDIRGSLEYLIQSEKLAVESYGSAREFLDAYDPDRPGCLVLDVRMPGMNGLELQKHLSGWGASIPVVMLTGHGDVPIAVRAMKAGAVDFVQKKDGGQALLESIHKAIELDRRNRREKAGRKKIAVRLASLTRREREVMQLIVAGMANKQIAHELSVSEKTIEVHRKHLMEKMGVRSAVELTRAVLSVGDAQALR